jgi:hypothetical protein
LLQIPEKEAAQLSGDQAKQKAEQKIQVGSGNIQIHQ